jgi:hypothetical protein
MHDRIDHVGGRAVRGDARACKRLLQHGSEEGFAHRYGSQSLTMAGRQADHGKGQSPFAFDSGNISNADM